MRIKWPGEKHIPTSVSSRVSRSVYRNSVQVSVRQTTDPPRIHRSDVDFALTGISLLRKDSRPIRLPGENAMSLLTFATAGTPTHFLSRKMT